jgi:DNA-binding winged helix-turn-helix (wHTH) protein/tetratricopeptide (TPR) repeat protein
MAKVFRFDDFVLDSSTYELRRGAAPVPVEPLVLDLLVLLLEQSGAVLSRDVLVASVWKGRIVSVTTITTAIKWARKALGDTGRDQKYVRTIRGRGVQFVGQLETEQARADDSMGLPSDAIPALLPALYVRPFDAMGDPGLDPVTRALRAQVGSILARVPLLQIVSPFPQADQLMDPRKLRSRFDISHVLDVRVQRRTCNLCADASLTETRSGHQIWAQQFEVDAGPGDQEILLHKMIRRIEPRLMQAMVTDMHTPGGISDFRAPLLQAIALLALRGWSRATFVEATGMIEKSIALEPNLALSHAYLALVKALGHRVGLLHNDDQLIPVVIASAERALELENQDSTILGLVGCALADVGQVDRALPILNKSIEAEPLNGHAKTALGAALKMKQDYKSAAMHLAEGMACSPADSRLSVWGTALSLAQLALGELESALESATNACQEDDRIYLPRLALAGVHLVRKEQTQATTAVQEALRIKPDLNLEEVAGVLGERLGGGVWSIAQSLAGSKKPAPRHNA